MRLSIRLGIIFLFCMIGNLHSEEYLFVDMAEHKQACLNQLAADPLKGQDPDYPLDRIIKTVLADDADYIPKDIDAGKIFEEGDVRYQLMHNGVKIIENGYYGAWMSDLIYALRGHHEPQEEKAFYEVLKYISPNSTMIELGSYWGYYSLWFSKTVPGATNWLIEPDASNREMGMKNFSLNKAEGYFYPGYIQMYPEDALTFSDAKRIYIDAFIKENNLGHIHLLHSDIQGAEYEMLLSAQESLKNRKIDYLFVSTHSPGIHAACKKLLLTYGYLIISEHTMNESCSVDGLIVARRNDIKGPTHISVRKYAND